MIEGELLNKLRGLPESYDQYFMSLYKCARTGSKDVKIPAIPEDLSLEKISKEVAAGTKDLDKVSTEDLKELAVPLKVGFSCIKFFNTAPFWAISYKRGIYNTDESES